MNLIVACLSAYQLFYIKQNKELYEHKVYIFCYILISICGFLNVYAYMNKFF